MEQLSFFEEAKTLEEEMIEKGLRRGSGFEGGRDRIREFVRTNPIITDLATFLKDEYGVGGFGSPDRTPYEVNGEQHDAKGVSFRYHDEKQHEHEVSLNWREAARLIADMVKEGRY